MSEAASEVTLISLADRVSIIEARLGIDPAAVVAGQQASAAAGADAHLGNPVSDPVEPQSAESALELALEKIDVGDHQGALDVVNAAVASWPDDDTLKAAQADVQKTVDVANAAPASGPAQS